MLWLPHRLRRRWCSGELPYRLGRQCAPCLVLHRLEPQALGLLLLLQLLRNSLQLRGGRGEPHNELSRIRASGPRHDLDIRRKDLGQEEGT